MIQDTHEIVLKDLRGKYKKQTLSVSEVAKEIGVSSSTIRTYVKQGIGVPSFRQVGGGKVRKKIVFPINEVAKYLSNLQQVY